MPARLTLGDAAPDFNLPDTVSGRSVSLGDFAGRPALVVTFICRHCPYVVHVQEVLARVAREYGERGVGFVAIGSNDAGRYPDDAPDRLAAQAREQGFPFPYLYDESQAVAKAFTAACTPDTFVFDAGGRLVYRGQLDETRPNSGRPATAADLRAALDAVLAGGPPPADQKPSVGCGIKWKPGNEPE